MGHTGNMFKQPTSECIAIDVQNLGHATYAAPFFCCDNGAYLGQTKIVLHKFFEKAFLCVSSL